MCFLHVFFVLLLFFSGLLKPRIPEGTVSGDVWQPPDWGFPPSRGRVNERCTQWAWFKCTNQHLSKDEPWLLSSCKSVGLIKHFLCITLCIRGWYRRGGRLSEDWVLSVTPDPCSGSAWSPLSLILSWLAEASAWQIWHPGPFYS